MVPYLSVLLNGGKIERGEGPKKGSEVFHSFNLELRGQLLFIILVSKIPTFL